MSPRGAWRLALVFFAAGLALRAALALVVVPAWEAERGVGATPDAYPALAATLLERGALGYGDEGATPTTVRGPAFPAWLVPGILLGGSAPAWMGLWGSLPGLSAGALVVLVAARRHGRLAGIVAGGVALLHPLPAIVSARAMGDDFYAATGVAALLAWWSALHARGSAGRGLGPTLAAGALLATHLLARSTGILTLAACVVAWLASRSRPRPALVVLLVALAVSPALAWSVRTSRLEERPVFVHSLLFYNFWVGEELDRLGPGPPPAGHQGAILDAVERRAGIDRPGPPRFYGTFEPREVAALERELGRQALERVTGDPLGYAARVLRGLWRFWVQAGTTRRTLQYALAVVPVLLVVLVGAVRVLRRGSRDDPGRLLLGVLVLHALAYAAVLPAARLSVQVYPELGYLAGTGAAAIGLVYAGRRGRDAARRIEE